MMDIVQFPLQIVPRSFFIGGNVENFHVLHFIAADGRYVFYDYRLTEEAKRDILHINTLDYPNRPQFVKPMIIAHTNGNIITGVAMTWKTLPN